jgi:hypothetical protein
MADITKILAEERILAVERQIRSPLPKGVERSILCPYCGELNIHNGQMFCCDLLRKAVLAVLIADRALKSAEAGERALVN